MSNKGKHKCSQCGCFDKCDFVEHDGKKKKYYCSNSCFRIAYQNNVLWGDKTCASCGMHMRYAISPMYAKGLDEEIIFFCGESCFAYHFDLLDEDSSDYKFIDERNHRFVKNKKEN